MLLRRVIIISHTQLFVRAIEFQEGYVRLIIQWQCIDDSIETGEHRDN